MIQGPTTRIGVGQRVQFVATDRGNRPYPKVTWNSFDEERLSLDSQGWATGLRTGALQIQALLDDSRSATLNVEVVDRAAAPQVPAPPAAAAAPPPPTPPPSGFTAGTTQAGPAGPATPPPNSTTPAPATPPAATVPGSGSGSANLLGIGAQGAPTPPASAGNRGFAVGATTAGSDPSQPPPGGGGQPGGSGSGGAGPQRGTPPPGPLQTRAVAGQPAAYHIFATGSRLGWASGLGQYSVGPADASIVEHLQVAGEHVMWANRESYLPVKAWPNWTANRAEIRSWADGLVRDPRNSTRRQISISAESRAGTLAAQLRYQTMGTPENVATCDAAYMNLGYELGYGQQTLGIADEAARNGDRALARQARQDGMSHLQNSNRILSEYERIVSLTGRCADLRDVRTRLDAILAMDIGDLSGQSRSTTAAWQLAIERIAALRGAQPAQGLPTPPTPPPPPRPTPPVPTPASPAPSQGFDPGELEGKWFQCQKDRGDESTPSSAYKLGLVARCLREGPTMRVSDVGFMVEFARSVSQYVGTVASDSLVLYNSLDPWGNWGGAAFQYRRSSEVFRLRRTASGTYEGEVFERSNICVPGECNPGWFATRLTVEGDVARQYFRGWKLYWVRWPPKHQAPASR